MSFPQIVAGGDAGVLPRCQSGAGGLQDGHEDGPERDEGAGQTQTRPCHPRTGEKHKREQGSASESISVSFSLSNKAFLVLFPFA